MQWRNHRRQGEAEFPPPRKNVPKIGPKKKKKSENPEKESGKKITWLPKIINEWINE